MDVRQAIRYANRRRVGEENPHGYPVVAIDDDKRLHRYTLHGMRVYGCDRFYSLWEHPYFKDDHSLYTPESLSLKATALWQLAESRPIVDDTSPLFLRHLFEMNEKDGWYCFLLKEDEDFFSVINCFHWDMYSLLDDINSRPCRTFKLSK